MQRVSNLMFTFIEPVHLAILTHHHHSNMHNNIDNNNNTVIITIIQFLLHIHKKESISSPHSNRSGIICNNFYPTLQAIYTIQKATVSNKVCGEAFHHWCW